MYSYVEDNNYIDEEKRSRLPFFIVFIVIVVIILAIVLSCGVKEKDKNNNLSYLKVLFFWFQFYNNLISGVKRVLEFS